MHHPEYHKPQVGAKLNRLRAAVLGANDGIVSIAGLVFGVIGAASSNEIVFATGVAGVVAGALSMAVGEYVSVSSSRDAERSLLKKEAFELKHYPESEFDELAGIYEKKGLTHETAKLVAKELTAHDAFKAHVEAELKLDPEHLTNPLQAALASGTAFTAGAVIPLIAVSVFTESLRIPLASLAVILSLVLTGYLSAWAGGANKKRAIARVVLGGALAMAITYAVGSIVGATAI